MSECIICASETENIVPVTSISSDIDVPCCRRCEAKGIINSMYGMTA